VYRGRLPPVCAGALFSAPSQNDKVAAIPKMDKIIADKISDHLNPLPIKPPPQTGSQFSEYIYHYDQCSLILTKLYTNAEPFSINIFSLIWIS
jgi:hypothetical protein